MKPFATKSRASFASCVSLMVLGAASLAAPASAQDQATASPKPAAEGGEIVVTAAAGNKTAKNSSISVTQVSQAAITDFTPRSQAEVLRTIPGLNVQDTAGPGGNANIGVRGIPVSTGGSEYVALQEDGLPVVLFGDIQFGNNDYWVRFDQNVDRVEAVRGGSASTFASQAPGAVINYVSKTGTESGGTIGISEGLSYRETRLDFDYGGHLSDTVRFHIGGYAVDGDGPTHLGYTAEKGYQIKGNITKDFADGNGYIRLNFKRMDDQEPTFTSMPALATLSGNTITGFSTFDGVDPRRYASTGIYNQSFQILNSGGGLQTVRMQGIHPVVSSLGGEFHRELGGHISVTDKFRWSNISGSFSNQWTGEASTASIIGANIGDLNSLISRNSAGTITSIIGVCNSVASCTGISSGPAFQKVGSIIYSTGPNAGQAYTGNFLSNSAQAYTNINDLGSLANDLTFEGKFELSPSARIDVHTGWFFMRQTISETWHVNNEIQTLDSNNNPVPLDLFSAAGAQLSANGLTGFNDQWGGCCGGRSYDVNYTDNAPYIDINGDISGFNLDASYRYDTVHAGGNAYAPVASGNISATDLQGTATLPIWNTAATPADVLNYDKGYSSWSLGALYKLTNTTNVFVRVSDGGRFNADRLLYGSSFNPDGSLDAGGQYLSVNRVAQQELGLKQYGHAGAGRYHVEATLYRAEVIEHNYDFTAPSRGESPFIDAVYHSYGLELSGDVHFGNFLMNAYVVYTHAKTVENGGVPADTVPVAMPKWTYLFSPSYDIGRAAIGVSVNGQSDSYVSGNIIAPGSTFVNGFVKVRPVGSLELGINVNNLFNTLGYRANNGSLAVTGPAPGLSANQAIFDNSAVLGRTASVSVKYHF